MRFFRTRERIGFYRDKPIFPLPIQGKNKNFTGHCLTEKPYTSIAIDLFIFDKVRYVRVKVGKQCYQLRFLST